MEMVLLIVFLITEGGVRAGLKAKVLVICCPVFGFNSYQRTRQIMEDFRPGDVVSFRAEDGQTVTGVLVRLNKKTVTVHTENGARWNVAPQLLTRVKRQLSSETRADNTLEK